MQNGKQKVLFVPAWYPARTDALAGIFTERHAMAIKDLFHVFVLYICPDANSSTAFELVTSEKEGLAVLTVYFKVPKRRTLFFSLIYGWQYLRAALKGYKEMWRLFGKPDLIHVHVLTRASIVPLLLRWFKRIPYVITEHWSRYLPEDNSYGGFLRKRVTELAVRNSCGVSSVSNTLIDAMKRHGLNHANFVKISNVVDTGLFQPLSLVKPIRPCFIHVSGFDPVSKNVKGIIDAALLADSGGMDFDLVLIGDGKERRVLESYVASKKFSNISITFTGELVGKALVEWFNRATAFILFSNYENQPCVVLEAFACGLPVIGTRAGGIPELIGSDSGLLVEPGNIEDLKEALNQFVQREVFFDKEVLREKALGEFSVEAVRSQLCWFYSRVL